MRESAENQDEEESAALEDGQLYDFITNTPVKDTPKEQVRQRIIRALFQEYGINVEDMETDFKVPTQTKRRSADIAIFAPGQPHTVEHLQRAVICDKEPKIGTKGAYRMRDHAQAKELFEGLHAIMAAVDGCHYGLWTNGFEFFFFHKITTRFEPKFEPVGDWPMGEESLGSRTVHSEVTLRRADAEMLKITFRRCHNFIHGNEGMPKDAAFWQFLYLIFAKMHDERRPTGKPSLFWAGPTEQFDAEGRKAIRARILPLFEEVKQQYPESKGGVFKGNEEITLSERALAFMVSELARYDFRHTDVDAKGAAYQEIVGNNLRGDRGQYFTPRGVIDLMVRMLDPKLNERVLDPACGTGGFLVGTIKHWLGTLRDDTKDGEDTAELDDILVQLQRAVESNLCGSDFDPFLVRATTMNITMAAGARARIAHMDSLSYPHGHLPGIKTADEAFPFGTVDVLMTNPPFGSDIPITDPVVLGAYDLRMAPSTGKKEEGVVRPMVNQKAMAPEVLFIERAVKWLKPGGRCGLVLPDGILGNPGDAYIRSWILRHCWVLASVDLPVEVFIAEANVNILTSLLLLKKKTEAEVREADLRGAPDYPVFMAVAEKVGVDRRGNTLYKRGPDGEELVEDIEQRERMRIGGRSVVRVLRRKDRIVDDDLPKIAAAYEDFRKKNPEPGVRR
jgi:type I restriction enzyme M protein